MKEFDVAISFAGEDRETARRTAELLQKLGYRVFFDEFEAHRLWGRNLAEYLSDIFAERALYCMLIVSKHYVEKPWPRLERQAAQARALVDVQGDYILPIRLDDSKIPGLPQSIGCIDLRKHDLAYVATQFKRKFDECATLAPISSSKLLGDLVRITRIIDMQSPGWRGLINPVASLDVWLNYVGPSMLFVDRIVLHHIESSLVSAASGSFPPSQKYKIEYSPGSTTDLPLDPPLVLNPRDQPEIHFEVEISPRQTVSGCSACLGFLIVRDDQSRTATLPLISPHPRELLTARVLDVPVVCDVADHYLNHRHFRLPASMPRSGSTEYVLEPSGAIAVDLTQKTSFLALPHVERQFSALREHFAILTQVASDLTEMESVACEAIRILGELGNAGTAAFLAELRSSGWTQWRRDAAMNALAELRNRLGVAGEK